ncbi:MAG: hypothetical protein ACHQQQ_14715, partial [Bacteroidota bacterium]
ETFSFFMAHRQVLHYGEFLSFLSDSQYAYYMTFLSSAHHDISKELLQAFVSSTPFFAILPIFSYI